MSVTPFDPFNSIVSALTGPELNHQEANVLSVMTPLKPMLYKMLDGLRVQYSNDIPTLREKMFQTIRSMVLLGDKILSSKGDGVAVAVFPK